MNTKPSRDQIDWFATIVPLVCVVVLAIVFMLFPGQSDQVIQTIRGFLGDTCGLYYAILGFGFFLCTMYIAFSKYGSIRLGGGKPEHSSFKWGVMIFTGTMGADIQFYSLCEWMMYANEKRVADLGGIQDWASTFPLFHWGPNAWSLYIILAVAFAFMLHVRGRSKQKFSESCRPILGDRVDGFWGKVIDLVAVLTYLCGLATVFSASTPLMGAAFSAVFGVPAGAGLTVAMLLVIAFVYTLAVWFGIKGISKLAVCCSYLFFAILAYFLIGGGEARYILETGFSAIGNMVQNFVGLSTWMDPLRETSFPQNWTFFYWAYWIATSIAVPFFIGMISKGRTIKNLIIGSYTWGLAGTFTSFIVLGNYGLAQQAKYGLDLSTYAVTTGDYSQAAIKVFETLPLPMLGLILLLVTMVAFYSTSLDSITLVVATYSYKRLDEGQTPSKGMLTFWAIMLILMPIALIFAGNTLYSLQSVSIIGAFPLGFIILLITACFFKDANSYLKEKHQDPQ